uniref:Uncharacterized protein n=1 Tax=viral metagenome TaxID=1070528 RepID=A0A6M3M654_9ZZZZ
MVHEHDHASIEAKEPLTLEGIYERILKALNKTDAIGTVIADLLSIYPVSISEKEFTEPKPDVEKQQRFLQEISDTVDTLNLELTKHGEKLNKIRSWLVPTHEERESRARS